MATCPQEQNFLFCKSYYGLSLLNKNCPVCESNSGHAAAYTARIKFKYNQKIIKKLLSSASSTPLLSALV